MFSPFQSSVFIDSLTTWCSILSTTLNSNMSITGQLSTLPALFLPYYHCIYYSTSFPPMLQPFHVSLSPHRFSSVIALVLSLSKLGTESFTRCRLSAPPASPASRLGPTRSSVIVICYPPTHYCPYTSRISKSSFVLGLLCIIFKKSTYLRSLILHRG